MQIIPLNPNLKKFNSQLELLARSFMPELKVSCGDVVETLLHGAKNKRPVLIYEIGVQIVGRQDTAARCESETVDAWRASFDHLAVDFYFYALRLDRMYNIKDEIGSGVSLHTLRKNMYVWQALHKGFNHIGLQWPIEHLINLPSSAKIREACECLVKAF